MLRYGGLALFAILALTLHAGPASALSLNPNLVIGGVPNSNSPGAGGTLSGDPFPWLMLEITTQGGGGAVTIQGWSSTPADWFYRALYLNIGNLESSLSGASWAASDLECTYCEYAGLSVGSNTQQATGSNFFDLAITYVTPNDSNSAWNRFSSNDMFSFTLTCSGSAACSSFNENSFDVLSAANNAPGSTSTPSGFRVAAELQGQPGGSSWIAGTGTSTTFTGPSDPGTTGGTTGGGTSEGPGDTSQPLAVPEPGMTAIIGAALLGAGLLKRRRQTA